MELRGLCRRRPCDHDGVLGVGEQLEYAGRKCALRITIDDAVAIDDRAAFRGTLIDRLIHTAIFGDEATKAASRWLIRAAAPRLGAFPASITAGISSVSAPRRPAIP